MVPDVRFSGLVRGRGVPKPESKFEFELGFVFLGRAGGGSEGGKRGLCGGSDLEAAWWRFWAAGRGLGGDCAGQNWK